MGKQFSKRARRRRQVDAIRHTVDGRSGTRIDSQVWLYRPVIGESIADVARMANMLSGDNIAPKLGSYTLSLVHPADINTAVRRSSMRGFISSERLYERLTEYMPSTALEDLEVEPTGYHDFGGSKRRIAVTVTSQELLEEGRHMMDDVNSYLGVKALREFRPHISIATGRTVAISNMDDMIALLPETIRLGIVKSEQHRVR